MTNGSAIGYMIIAARKLKLDEKTIKELESLIEYVMDIYTEDEAESVYQEGR